MTTEMKLIVRKFVIQLLIYAVILALYFTLILRHLGDPLTELFDQSLLVYAGASLLLVVMQALFLDTFLHFIFKKLGVEA